MDKTTESQTVYSFREVDEIKIDRFHFITMPPEKEGVESPIFLLADPFTWTWLLAQIAGGIIGFEAARAWARWTGRASTSNAMEDVFRRFADLLSQALEEDAIREAKSHLDNVQRMMSHYSRTNSADDLQGCYVDCGRVVSVLKGLSEPGQAQAIGAFSIAAGLYLSILQEKTALSQDPHTKDNIADATAEFEGHVDAVLPWMREFEHGKHGVCKDELGWVFRLPARHGRHMGYFGYDLEACENARREHFERHVWNPKFKPEVDKIMAARSSWVNVRQRLPGWDMQRG